MEVTITQNGALYFAQRKVLKVPKRRAAPFWPFRTTASEQGLDIRGVPHSGKQAKRRTM
jgi:hypothetical protein